MIKIPLKLILSVLSIAMLFSSCGDDDTQSTSGDGKYVIMTATEKWDAGYLTSFGNFPAGTVNNITPQSLQMTTAFGFRSYKNWIFNRTNAAGDVGLQKFTLNADGSFKDEGFLPNASQFLILDDASGFYLDETRGALKIQKFNPSTMTRTGEIDLSSLKKEGVEYQVIGKHTLAAKEGKLYAGITYGTITAQGYGDDVVDYVEFAVIDIATGKLDKTIKYDGLKSIGWGSAGNKMWTLGDDGGLYFFSTGLGFGFTTSSVIRINKGETDFDRNWIVRASDLGATSSIATGLVKNGKLYIELSSEPLAANYENLQDFIFDYYEIDLATKAKTKLTGMPPHHYCWANEQAITEIDGKLYFWVRNQDEKIDGYYVLNGTNATQAFNVGHDGFMWGFVKLD